MSGIPFNPYIVGNPIRTREMFFGREDDFQFVVKKLGAGASNQVLVFCGERRCGKTSILFQILNGRLGERFLPVLVDMQILAGIKDDRQFFRAMLKVACSSPSLPGFSLEELDQACPSGSLEDLFESFLVLVESRMPDRILLFLLDEYELIEEKIQDGSLSEAVIHYLSGALESSHRICFIFTGSTNLENRKVSYWRSLLVKSIYRKISYLSAQDTARLITEPLKDHLHYPEELVSSIYRLTGGHPFYTQVICQNLVDQLMEQERSDPAWDDLEQVVQGIVDNPLPQMIYSWNSLSDGHRLLLAALAAHLSDMEDWAGSGEILQYLRRNRLSLPFDREQLAILLEDAYHREHLEKTETAQYRFRMDLWRRWTRREHSIWKVAKDSGVELRKRSRLLLPIAAALAALAVGFGIWFGLRYISRPKAGPAEAGQASPAPEEAGARATASVPKAAAAPATAAGPAEAGLVVPEPEAAPSAAPAPEAVVAPTAAAAQAEERLQPALEVLLTANAVPFRVVVDGTLNLASEGQEEEGVIRIAELRPGRHRFDFVNPATGETLTLEREVSGATRLIRAEFQSVASGAASQAAALPETGALLLTTAPAGALIFLDGQETGLKTPNLFEGLAAGQHRVNLRLEGFRAVEVDCAIVPGQTARRELVLSESFGQVVFDVRPTAKILLDGKPLIETPYVQPVRIRSGRHTLTLINEQLGVRREVGIEVREGDTLRIVELLK